jgi:hypothetical protein
LKNEVEVGKTVKSMGIVTLIVEVFVKHQTYCVTYRVLKILQSVQVVRNETVQIPQVIFQSHHKHDPKCSRRLEGRQWGPMYDDNYSSLLHRLL